MNGDEDGRSRGRNAGSAGVKTALTRMGSERGQGGVGWGGGEVVRQWCDDSCLPCAVRPVIIKLSIATVAAAFQRAVCQPWCTESFVRRRRYRLIIHYITNNHPLYTSSQHQTDGQTSWKELSMGAPCQRCPVNNAPERNPHAVDVHIPEITLLPSGRHVSLWTHARSAMRPCYILLPFFPPP